MVVDLIESAARRLYLGVCVEARAALATTLAKLRPKQISVLLVTDPRRAQELTTEVETYSQWLSPKKALQILHFPERPRLTSMPPAEPTESANASRCSVLY